MELNLHEAYICMYTAVTYVGIYAGKCSYLSDNTIFQTPVSTYNFRVLDPGMQLAGPFSVSFHRHENTFSATRSQKATGFRAAVHHGARHANNLGFHLPNEDKCSYNFCSLLID